MTIPTRRNLQAYEGANFSFTFTEKDEAGSLVDNTGNTARMNIRTRVNGTSQIALSSADGEITLGGTGGTITVAMTATQMSDWTRLDAIFQSPAQGLTGTTKTPERLNMIYRYDLELETTGGTVRRPFHGEFHIVAEVTE